MKEFLKVNKKGILFAIIIVISIVFAVSLGFKYRVSIAWLAPSGTHVSDEQLDKDISTILSLYGLKKDRSDLLQDETNSIYQMHYQKDGSKGKSVFVSVDPILYGSTNHTEIETLMEMWLYIDDHQFDYSIDGITYYFTATHIKHVLGPLRPNEIYMSKDEFYSLYNELNADELSHPHKVKALAEAYVDQNNYKRHSGHVQLK